MSDTFALRGRYTLELIRDGEPTETIVISNLVTTVGKAMVASLISDQFNDQIFQYFALGDSNTAPNVADIKLSSEVGRVAIETIGAVNNIITVTGTVPNDELVGFTLQEIGLFGIDAGAVADSGHIFSRALLDTPITKDNVTVINITYELTVS